MAGEAATIAAELPPWLQWAAQAALFVVTAVGGVAAVVVGKRRAVEHESEPFDPEELLDSSPIKRLIAAFETMADNAKLQTEAVKTISAAATAMARTVEEDFDERRVLREVERRLGLMTKDRSAAPPQGWGG